MRKKTVFLFFAGVILFAPSVLFAGGQKDPASTEDDGKVTLTLLVDKDTSLEGIKAVAAKIEKELNIETLFELRPGGSEGENVLKTRLATGEVADLIYFNSGSLLTALNPERNFIDLTNEPYMETFTDSYKTTVTVNGKIFGIPASSSAVGGWLYNKQVYREMGLSIPKTWDELMSNCQVIKDAGLTAVIGSYKDAWTSQLILLSDYYYVHMGISDFANKYTKNEINFSSTAKAVRAFEKLADVFNRGYMNTDFNATTYDEALRMLAMGEGVHYPMLTFAFAVLASNYPEALEDIGIFAQPGDSADVNGATVWLPNSIYLYKDSPNREAVLKWAEYYISPEGIAVYASVNKAEGPYVVKGVEIPKDRVYPGTLDLMIYFNEDRTAPALEFITPVKGPNLPQICVEVGSGFISPLEAAQKYDRDVKKQAKQLNLPGW